MRFSKSMRAFTATACCASLFSQTCVFGQESITATSIITAPVAVATPVPPASKPGGVLDGVGRATKTLDIELAADNSIIGQLVNNNGAAIATAPVEIWQNGRLIQTSMTDQKGVFRLASLTGGTYELNFGDRIQTARCWTSGSAPPQSKSSLRIVADEEVVRAQQGCGAVCGVLNPWIIVGVVVAAVAIPVAMHNNRSDRPASN